MAAVFVFKNYVHPALFVSVSLDTSTSPPTRVKTTRFEFLPLMAMSVTCAVALVAYWYRLYIVHRRKMIALEQYTLPLKPSYEQELRQRNTKRFQFATDSE